MPYWDSVFDRIAAEYPDVRARQMHVDALAAEIVLHPDRLDVIVGSNLFGDILSDLAAAVTGGLGLAPSGNINPDRAAPSMFESVHGSAPDIAGQGIANPIAQILAAAMMLDHLGETKAATAIDHAVAEILAEASIRTPTSVAPTLRPNSAQQSPNAPGNWPTAEPHVLAGPSPGGTVVICHRHGD